LNLDRADTQLRVAPESSRGWCSKALLADRRLRRRHQSRCRLEGHRQLALIADPQRLQRLANVELERARDASGRVLHPLHRVMDAEPIDRSYMLTIVGCIFARHEHAQ